MSKDYIIHFQPDDLQIVVGEEIDNGQMKIINVIKGNETLIIMDCLLGNNQKRKERYKYDFRSNN